LLIGDSLPERACKNFIASPRLAASRSRENRKTGVFIGKMAL
jgi:hypothetical protein